MIQYFSMKNKLFFFCCALFLFLALSYFANYSKYSVGSIAQISPSQTASPSAHVLGVRTKSAACQVNGPVQDKNCTPGAVFKTATKNQICVPGYSQSVRNVPDSEKKQVYEEYGIITRARGEYEVDHLISLELGGSNDIANLWPEAADPRPGFHEKDMVENYLHDQVCSGRISLKGAQLKIANDWITIYKMLP